MRTWQKFADCPNAACACIPAASVSATVIGIPADAPRDFIIECSTAVGIGNSITHAFVAFVAAVLRSIGL